MEIVWTVTVAVAIVSGYVNGLYVARRRMYERIPSEVQEIVESMGHDALAVGNKKAAYLYFAAAGTLFWEMENRFA